MSKKENVFGQKFGKLTIIGDVETDTKTRMVKCKCDCGNEYVGSLKNIKTGATTQCKECRKNKYKNNRTTKYEVSNDITTGITKTGIKFIFNTKHLNKVIDYSWCVDKDNHVVTKYTSDDGQVSNVSLSRIIMGVQGISFKLLVVDHIDGNALNNLDSNMRVCTQQQNSLNRNKPNSKDSGSSYKGVIYLKNKKVYTARINFKGKCTFIGNYKTEIEAAEAYNEKAIEIHGEFARINDINNPGVTIPVKNIK